MKNLLIIALLFPMFCSASFDRDLFYGLRNDPDVEELQEFLTDQGFFSGQVTGNFFSLTLSAVKRFQIANFIIPSAGYFGPKTRLYANGILAKSVSEQLTQAEKEVGTTTLAENLSAVNAQPKDNSVTLLQKQIELLNLQLQELQKQNERHTTPNGTVVDSKGNIVYQPPQPSSPPTVIIQNVPISPPSPVVPSPSSLSPPPTPDLPPLPPLPPPLSSLPPPMPLPPPSFPPPPSPPPLISPSPSILVPIPPSEKISIYATASSGLSLGANTGHFSFTSTYQEIIDINKIILEISTSSGVELKPDSQIIIYKDNQPIIYSPVSNHLEIPISLSLTSNSKTDVIIDLDSVNKASAGGIVAISLIDIQFSKPVIMTKKLPIMIVWEK